MLHRPALLASLLLPALVSAVDVAAPQPPDWLEQPFRAEWQMRPLRDVLAELERTIGRPLVRSPRVAALAPQRLIGLMDTRKSPLRGTLAALEADHDLRFTAEPLQLRVETLEDVRERLRRPVDLALAEYGLFVTAQDLPGPDLGWIVRGSPGGGFSMEGTTSPPPPPDDADVMDWLGRLAGGDAISRRRDNLRVNVTPDEERALRAGLEEVLRTRTRQSAWRVTWGVLPAGEPVATGLIAADAAAAVVQRLEARTEASLRALPGQLVHGGTIDQRTMITDLEVVSAHLDPTVEQLATGRTAELRPSPGIALTHLEYRLQWVEPADERTAIVREPPRRVEGEVETSSTVDPDTDEVTTSTTSAPGRRLPGRQVPLALPSLWSWQPAGGVVIGSGQALALAAAHPQGTAVILVEAQP